MCTQTTPCIIAPVTLLVTFSGQKDARRATSELVKTRLKWRVLLARLHFEEADVEVRPAVRAAHEVPLEAAFVSAERSFRSRTLAVVHFFHFCTDEPQNDLL